MEDDDVKTQQADGKKEAADLDKVTDITTEKELDTAKAEQSVKSLLAGDKSKDQLKAQRERELAAVTVSADDVAVLAAEFELSTAAADRLLREHNADLASALRQLVNAAQ
eukprot:TRINITY_DN28479_c0_g1_i1.p1 TRINITY_DN28479_c0_g1~~TRINITY_DN28479_c0_g1_i1.p1  ORF type:complete len:110 (+),score=42.95 TRINITY_DN28479_c0_g1_i1:272-601(+)